MDAVLKVVGTIGAIWLAVSILVAVFWGLAGRKIFRKPPAPPSEASKYAASMRQYREYRKTQRDRDSDLWGGGL